MTALINRDEFIKRLITRRKSIGLTQEALAEAIRRKYNNNFSMMNLSKIERGILNSKYETLYWIDNTIEQFENQINSQKNLNNMANSNSDIRDILEKTRRLVD